MCWSFDDQSLCEWKIFDFCTSINVSAVWLGQSHRRFCFSMFNPISDLMPFTDINQRLKGYQMRSMYAHCIERRLGLIPGCQSYSKSTPTLKNTNIFAVWKASLARYIGSYCPTGQSWILSAELSIVGLSHWNWNDWANMIRKKF